MGRRPVSGSKRRAHLSPFPPRCRRSRGVGGLGHAPVRIALREGGLDAALLEGLSDRSDDGSQPVEDAASFLRRVLGSWPSSASTPALPRHDRALLEFLGPPRGADGARKR